MRNKKTNDHYVPRVYLRRFLTPGTGTLFAYYKDKDGYFQPVPESICAEKDWDELDDKGKEPSFLKQQLQSIEPNLDTCLNQLIKHPLHNADRFALSIWLAILHSLSPNSLTHFDEFVEKMGNITLQMMLENPSTYFSEKELELYAKYKDKITLKANKYYSKNMAMSIVYPIALSIYMSDWVVITNKTPFKYLTCDKPFHFICWNDNPNNQFNPKGIALDPEHYLRIEPLPVEIHNIIKQNRWAEYTTFKPGNIRYDCFMDLTKHNARAISFINKHTIYNAERFILSQNRDKNLDSFIRHNRKFCTKTILEEMDLGRGGRIALSRLKNTFPNFEFRRKNRSKKSGHKNYV